MAKKNEQQKTQEIERIKLKEAEMQEFVNSFSDKKGIDKAKEIGKWVGTGIFMGASDAVPGYSGGTTLALIGFFKKLVLMVKSIFVPSYGLTRMRALLFMVPFGIGWIAGVFGIAKATEAMASHGRGLELMFFFAAFVIAAIPIYMRSIKYIKGSVKKNASKKRKYLLIAIGFIIVLTLALAVLLVKGGALFHGVDKGEEHFPLTDWWLLALVAYGAGMVTLIPGGSGAIIQLLSGMYDKIHWTILANVTHNFWALIIFALFTFLGMLTMVFILSWFLVKHERSLELFSLGMLLASPLAIMIVPETSLWGNIKEWPHILGIMGSAFAGFALGFSINYYTKKKHG